MADLSECLPNYDLTQWRHLTYSLERKGITTSELISVDPIEIAKRCPLPLKEVRRMASAVTTELKADLGYGPMRPPPRPKTDGEEPPRKKARMEEKRTVPEEMRFVRTLDANIDDCLGGGFPAGYISEIVGESAVGKTQFVLSLLLTAQLPAPQGLGRPVIYLSTEGSLNTKRLGQILHSHPQYQGSAEENRPSMDDIHTIDVRDIVSQEHITQYQLPEAVRRFNVGMIVIDSIAANFRVHYQGISRKVLAERAIALSKLGRVLRQIAHEHNVAVVVTNQVADRFDDARTTADKLRLSSQTHSQSSSTLTPQPSQPKQSFTTHEQRQTDAIGTQQHNRPGQSISQIKREELLSLDYQQRFFTGWGDDPSNPSAMKTPALGLTWANQLDARIVLKMETEYSRPLADSSLWSDVKRRRTLQVVYAPWVAPTQVPVKYEVEMWGPVSLVKDGKSFKSTQHEDFDENDEFGDDEDDDEHAELLNPKYWEVEDDEFP